MKRLQRRGADHSMPLYFFRENLAAFFLWSWISRRCCLSHPFSHPVLAAFSSGKQRVKVMGPMRLNESECRAPILKSLRTPRGKRPNYLLVLLLCLFRLDPAYPTRECPFVCVQYFLRGKIAKPRHDGEAEERSTW